MRQFIERLSVNSLLACAAVAGVQAQHGDRRWIVDGQDEYTITFVSHEDGYAWMLSCGTYAGPPLYGPGIHYIERPASERARGVWDPNFSMFSDDPPTSSRDASVTGKWVYAVLHRGELPEPFENIAVPPLANFGEVWRETESEEVCTHRVQSYRREQAKELGYPAEALDEDWGATADGILVYKVRIYNGGANPPDLISLELSCQEGLGVEARVLSEDYSYEEHDYDALGWGNGDERVVYAALHGESVPTALDYVEVDGLAKLWPHFVGRCTEAESAYEAIALGR